MDWALLLTVFAALVGKGRSGHVLCLFIHPGYSHFHSYYPILSALARRGHDVKVVTFFPAKGHPPRYEEILLAGGYAMNGVSVEDIQPSRSVFKLIQEYYILEQEGKEACRIFYESGAVKLILDAHAKRPFDLTILEVFNTDCQLGVAELVKTPIVGLSSCALMPWHYDRVGLPDFPSYIPSEFVSASSDMNFLERLKNFFIVRITKILYRYSQVEDNKIIYNSLKLKLDVGEIAKNTSVILLNQHYSLSGPRPLSPKVVEIGGAHIPATAKLLPQDLLKFIDESEKGVIFISWGSMVNFSSIPIETLRAIERALSKFEESVVWKLEMNGAITSSKRIFVAKWIQQYDLLCHKNVKLFWSHGGLLGTSESVHCGIPMVITPMYGDQYLNAKAVKSRKMAEVLEYKDITEKSVYNTILKVLHPDYAWHAKYVSNVFRNRQNPPLETATWWIEHVLHTKGNNLTYSPSIEMNWFTYHSIDAMLALLLVGLLGFSVPFFCLRKILGFIRKHATSIRISDSRRMQKKKSS